jgi:hypothetical protein
MSRSSRLSQNLASWALGAGFVAGLLLALKTKTVDHLVTSLQTWIKVRRPQVKLTFRTKGRSLTLHLQNTTVDKELVENLKSLLAEVQ